MSGDLQRKAGETRSSTPCVVPGATYRIQFHAGFRLSDATALVPYLSALGVTHLYASSYLKARTGSQHGYDIVDHNALNPEIGTADDHQRLCDALAEHGMSQILDIVPNHMGVLDNDNAWWTDVVENGVASPWSDTFDIDWFPSGPRLDGQVLLPILGKQYGEVLESGELTLSYGAQAGTLVVSYFEHEIPLHPQDVASILRSRAPTGVDPAARRSLERILTTFAAFFLGQPERGERLAAHLDRTAAKAELRQLVAARPAVATWIDECVASFAGTVGRPQTFDALDALIARQPWRLAYWRVAADEVNYRRFFEVSTLAAVRMEDPDVFAETHATVLRWVAEGKLTGLRIDHPDGLAEPRIYFERLQSAFADARDNGGPPGMLYVAIEKILAEHEHWPVDWPVHGDTGYRFSNLVNGLFVDSRNEAAFDRLYADFIGRRSDYDAELIDAKRYVIFHLLASDLHALTDAAFRIAQGSRRTRDFTYNGLRSALVELAAGMPVYRTYIGQDGIHDIDRRHLEWATNAARKRGALTEDESIGYLVRLMTDSESMDPQRLQFVRRFQQFTSPVMAKAMEDTAFYRFNRLVSLNDVGGDPMEFGLSVGAFHSANRARARHMPLCMLGGSTHDSKRSEDVRARLDVLSEVPDEWSAAIARWRELRQRQVPRVENEPVLDANDELLLYQTLVGAWPLGELDDESLSNFRERIQAYMLKALREAKATTSWLRPDEAYEAAVARAVDVLLSQLEPNPFLTDLRKFVSFIARFGCANSLSMVTLKLTSPGIPDIYQGCEEWSLSLVDPDNRRPVDFERRAAHLEGLRHAWSNGSRESLLGELRDTWWDGRLKLLVTWRLLVLRSREASTATQGQYEALQADGPSAEHVVACVRTDTAGNSTALTVATRLLRSLYSSLDASAFEAPEVAWRGTVLMSPVQDAGAWIDVLSGARVVPVLRGSDWVFDLQTLLRALPVAQLWRSDPVRSND